MAVIQNPKKNIPLKFLTAKLIFGTFSETYYGTIKVSYSLKSKRATHKIAYISLKHIDNQISRVPKWLHMFHYAVAMVTKKTQIFFFYINFSVIEMLLFVICGRCAL